MQAQHREVLTKNLSYLSKNLKIEETNLLNILHKMGIFSKADLKQIEREHYSTNSFVILLQRKGPRAFNSFAKALEETGQMPIAKKLGAIQTPLPSNFKRRDESTADDQEKDDELIKCTGIDVDREDPFLSVVLSHQWKFYSMNHEKRLEIILLNNYNFPGGIERCTGMSDEPNLKHLKTLYANLIFKPWKNIKSKNLPNLICDERKKYENVMEKSLMTADVFIMVMLSCNDGSGFWDSEGKKIDVEEQIVAEFSETKAQHLKGIPKIFIIQTCRGIKEETKMALSSGQDEGPAVQEPVDEQDVGESATTNTSEEEAGVKLSTELYHPSDQYDSVPTMPPRDPSLINDGSWIKDDMLIIKANFPDDDPEKKNCQKLLKSFIIKLMMEGHCLDVETIAESVVKEVTEKCGSGGNECKMESHLKKKLFLLPGYPIDKT